MAEHQQHEPERPEKRSVYERLNPDAPVRERWSRDAFTFRRMTPGQIGGLAVGLIVLVIVVALLI